MAACFSSAGRFSLSPIFILSRIKNLTESMEKNALPGISIKHVQIPEDCNQNSTLTDKQIDFIKDAEIVVCDGLQLISSYKYMKNLKWAHCTWAGVEELFKQIPDKPNFAVTRHAGDSFCELMAEYVMCQILSNERSSKMCWENQAKKNWLNNDTLRSFRSLNQITVSILGVGNMGSAIAGFLKSRGANVLGFCRTQRSSSYYSSFFNKISVNLEDVFEDCDYLCNTLPSTPLTRGLLDNSVLQKCHKKPVFINVGRGDIISEKEILFALRNEWLSGAILDVFENEPLKTSSELWTHPKVTITPHVAAISKPEHIAEEFFQNLMNYIDGHGLKNCISWDTGY